MKLNEIVQTEIEIIEKFLSNHNISNYTIRNDGKVDIDGNVNLEFYHLLELPIEFGNVTGNFWCSNNNLKSLDGSPDIVDGDFYCVACHDLKSLEGGPKIVKGNYTITSCHGLKSLKGCPEEIGGKFKIENCSSLPSLNYGPKSVGGSYDCYHCLAVTNIDGLAKQINGELLIREIPKLKKYLKIFNTKGITRVELTNKKLQAIINKYLPKRDMLNCQDELIEAGFEEYAEIE